MHRVFGILVLAATALVASCTAASRSNAPHPASEETAPRSTFANPLDLDYRFMPSAPSRREAADPMILRFHGDYYLFASKSGGYWWSPDMRAWTLVAPTGFDVEAYAPSAIVIDGRMYYTAHKAQAIYTTDDPKAGRWRKVADLASYADPNLWLDDDGKLYLSYGSSLNGGISQVQLNPHDNFRVVAGPVELMHADYDHHGWERSGPDNLGATMSEGFRIAPYVEGSWMTKHDGTYYLQYAAPGTVWDSYADGVYTSRSPMSGFTYASYSPFSYKPGGFVGSAGHGGTFQDAAGHWWRVVTMDISVAHKFERRIGIVPAGFDADGVVRADTYLGDYPQLLPGVASNPLDHNATGWMLLSAGKRATASSSLEGHEARLAFDENIRTQWSARTGDAGEWLAVDLGRPERIHAIQLNFGEQDTRVPTSRAETGAAQWVLERSDDGARWTMLVDRHDATRDAPHAYVQLDTPVTARWLRVTNVRTAAGGKFAMRDLRVFGVSDALPPTAVKHFNVTRSIPDDRSVTLAWERVVGATGYVVRFGIARDKLYTSWQVGDIDRLTMNSLNAGVPYWFAIDAVGEGGVTRGPVIAADTSALPTTGGYRGRYNNDNQSHADLCVRLRHANAALRYADGTPTGWVLTPSMLRPNAGNAVSCPDSGMARLDAREIVTGTDGEPMLFHRGGWGFEGDDQASAVHYGHVRLSDLESSGARYERAVEGGKGQWRAAPIAPWAGPSQAAGNGAECSAWKESTPRSVAVQRIPGDVRYLNSAQTNAVPYAIYGDPSEDLGPAADRARGIKYTMLTWSWINVRGGGVARSLVRDGERFRECTDVPPIRLSSVADAASRRITGWVEARYGAIGSEKEPLFGWLVVRHRHGDEPVVEHLR
ncbi:MAG TPA: family 43 glycosylhydrolase [Gemmatimonadaceae bacterium]